jgi:Predicted peptidase
MQKLLPFIIGLLAVQTALGQAALYKKRWYINGKDTLRYRVLLPLDYDSSQTYPLVLFLHGAGERGNNNEDQLKHGSQLFTDSAVRKKYPAIVLFPQCGRNDFWARIKRNPEKDSLGGIAFPTTEPMGKALNLVSLLLDSLVTTQKVDPRKVYVGGLSMGGMGTFELLWRKPGFFAAAFPICGGGNPETVKLYGRKFPIWVFHGGSDPVVRVSNSRLMVNALKAAKAKVKYSEYPGVGHNSWDNAFAEPDLMPWLFKQRKKL